MSDLIAEIDDLIPIEKKLAAWKELAGSYWAEIERLRAALERYGQHEDECNVTIKMMPFPTKSVPCNCGLSEALRGVGETIR